MEIPEQRASATAARLDSKVYWRRVAADQWVVFGILALGALVIAVTASDYGVSWDEPLQQTYGELVRQYFVSGGQDDRCNRYGNLAIYGPGFELPAAVICRVWPGVSHEIRHGLTALCALLTVPAVVRIGRRLASPWLGVIAGVCLLLLPAFYGHAFINSKDIPFACLYTWVMAAMIDCCLQDSVKLRYFATAGVSLGLMLSVRPGGLPLIILMGACLFVWMVLTRGRECLEWRRQFLQFAFLTFCAAWVIMVLPWPFAHSNLLLHPLEAIRTAMHFPLGFPMIFDGEQITSNDLPRRYLLQYLLITTPPSVLLFCIVGLIAGFAVQWREPRGGRSLVLFAMQIWILAPIAIFVLKPPNVYDGIRHFLFLMPAIALWCGLGLACGFTFLRHFLSRATSTLVVVSIALLPLPALIRLHPYAYTYYNDFVGGVAGASQLYETEYWLTSYREALEWINQQATQNPVRTYQVLVVGPLGTVQGYEAANVNLIAVDFGLLATPRDLPERLPPGIDFCILSTRQRCHMRYPLSPIIHAVGRHDGAAFCVVRASQAGRQTP